MEPLLKINPIICIEDMYYYAGKSYYNYSYYSKLEKLKDIFKYELLQIALVDKYTIFGLPLIFNDLQLLVKNIQSLPYNISDIKFRFFENDKSKKILYMKYFNLVHKKKKIIHTRELYLKLYPILTPTFIICLYIKMEPKSIMIWHLFPIIKPVYL